MKIRSILILCAISICYAVSWGQTWKLTETMTAKLDKSVFTVSTTKSAEAMPDYDWVTNPIPWGDNLDEIHSVVIADKVTSVGTWAFRHCASLTSVTLSNSVVNIAEFAFYNCYKLPSIKFPESLTTIGPCAFSLCQSLVEIEIPSSVSYINSYAFGGCDQLTSFRVSDNNAYYSTANGVLYDKDKKILMQYPKKKNDAIFNIPNTVEIIESSAFFNASFDSISIPNSVKVIRNEAFKLCFNLTSITIPNSVTEIADYAFADCSGLKTVTIVRANPLKLPDSTFNKVKTSAATLRVPTGTTKAYRDANVWKDFGKFVEFYFDYSNIEPIRRDGACPVSAWTHDGILHITGLIAGEPLYIYNSLGQLLYHNVSSAEEIQIPYTWRGVAVIVSGKQHLKIVQ